jgi:hypothetical protein
MVEGRSLFPEGVIQMRKDMLRLTLFGLLVIAIAGCEVSDPGSAIPNQPPETRLVLAPAEQDTFNHFVHMRWSATDPNGDIAGFWIIDRIISPDTTIVDTLMFTTAYDDTIAFYAPGDTIVAHRIQVIAVDNEGLQDTSPPSRFFYASNTRPTVAFAATSVPNGAAVGRGFAIELQGEDSNPSSLLYSIAIDDSIEEWSPWSYDPIFLFCDTMLFRKEVDGVLRTVPPPQTTLMHKDVLALGEHTIYARVKDAGEALGRAMISIHLTVAEGFRPSMDTLVVGKYGADDFYLDGSVFYKSSRETKLTFSASAASYYGRVHTYSYAIGDAPFDPTRWLETPEIVLADAPAGEYLFRIRARDIAGAVSDTISYRIFILDLATSDTILIVDETRDGTGGAGSPNDAQVDDFYEAIVGTRPHQQIDYATHKIPPTPDGVSYLSPLDLYHCGLVIYHADDKANFNILSNRVVLAEYLDRGGKAIFSGWNLFEPFGINYPPDSASYGPVGASDNPYRFVYTYMRLFYAIQSTATSPREFKGITGVGGYPDVAVDPAKIPPSWAGALDRCWVFNNRGETITLGKFDAASGDPRFEGRNCAHVYIGPVYSVAVFGFPLYFAYQEQAQAFMDRLLTEMLSH